MSLTEKGPEYSFPSFAGTPHSSNVHFRMSFQKSYSNLKCYSKRLVNASKVLPKRKVTFCVDKCGFSCDLI